MIRAISKRFLCFLPNGDGFGLGGEIAEMHAASSFGYLSVPGFSLFMPQNATYAACAVAPQTRVPQVRGAIYTPKVDNAIVVSDLIDVIDFVRPFARPPKPDQAVNEKPAAIYDDSQVAITIRRPDGSTGFASSSANGANKLSSFGAIIEVLADALWGKMWFGHHPSLEGVECQVDAGS